MLTPFAPYVTSFSAGEITCIGLLCGVASGPFSRSLAFSVNAPANMTDLHIEVVAESSAEFPPQGPFRGVSLDSLRLLSPPPGGLGPLIHIFGTGAHSSFDTLGCSAGVCTRWVDYRRQIRPAVSLPYNDFTIVIDGESGGPGNIDLSVLVTGSTQIVSQGPIGRPAVIPLPAALWLFAGGFALLAAGARRTRTDRGA